MTEGRNKKEEWMQREGEEERERESEMGWRKGQRRLRIKKDNHGIEEETE